MTTAAEKLIFAAQFGNVDLLAEILSTNDGRALLQQSDIWTQFGDNLNDDTKEERRHSGDRPLHRACRFGQLPIISRLLLLLDHNHNQICQRNNRGELAIGISAQRGYLEIVKFLLEKHPKFLEERDGNKNTALNSAAIGGDLAVVEFLVVEMKANLENRGDLSKTALLQSAERGHLNVVEFLLKSGANIEAKSHRLQDSAKMAIHLAAQNGHASVVASLLAKRPDFLEAADKFGDTPLNYACFRGHLQLVQFLVLEKRANVERRGQLGMTAFLHAVNRGHTEIVAFLLEKASNDDILETAVDSRGKTAIELAVYYGYSQIVAILLKKKPSLRCILSAAKREAKLKLLPRVDEEENN